MSTLIFEKLAAIQKEIDPIAKNQTNQGQRYNFRGVDDVYNALHPLLAKHEVVTMPWVLEARREDRVTSKGSALIYTMLRVEFAFYAKDGSTISCICEGEGMDSGDKSTNKAMAAAHKYALTQVFTIPYEGQIDADSESHTVQSKLDTAIDNAIAGLMDVESDGAKAYANSLPDNVKRSTRFVNAYKQQFNAK
jgi:hypothetical protein